MTYIIAVWVPPHRERSVVPTRNFTPRLSSLSTYLSCTIGGSGTCTKYASVVCTNIWIFMKDASTISRRYSQLIGANDRRVLFQCDRSRSRFRLAANVVLAAFLCVSLFHILSFFFLFQLRTMLFHLHSLFTSRALHASRLFLFVQLSFFSCPLSCLLVFYVLQSVPYVFFWVLEPPSLFSQLSFDHAESRFPLYASDISENFPLDTKSSIISSVRKK